MANKVRQLCHSSHVVVWMGTVGGGGQHDETLLASPRHRLQAVNIVPLSRPDYVVEVVHSMQGVKTYVEEQMDHFNTRMDQFET